MHEIVKALKEQLQKDRLSVLATIIRQAGPSPRDVGTMSLIMYDGSIAGTIGGGVLEARVVEEAKKIFKTGLPVRLHFSLQGIDVAETEMLCGGQVELFLEPVYRDDSSHLMIFQRGAEIKKSGGTALMVTRIDPESWGHGKIARALLEKDGKTTGSLPGFDRLENALKEEIERFAGSRQPAILSLKDDKDEVVEVFVEPIRSESFLYLFGGGHVSQQVVPLASLVGFHVIVIDDRRQFVDPALFPGAKETLHLPFKGVMDRFSINEYSYLAIITRGHSHDKEVLAQALKTGAKYIGMIGSKRKREVIYQKLTEEGFSRNDLDRVHSPIGLDIDAETPQEIAVSIVAELIQERVKD